MTSQSGRAANVAATDGPLYGKQLCFVTTATQVDALDEIAKKHGLSRAAVAREVVDAGLHLVSRRLERSTLTRRRGSRSGAAKAA